MPSEKMKILEMVSQGKITADEAARLLRGETLQPPPTDPNAEAAPIVSEAATAAAPEAEDRPTPPPIAADTPYMPHSTPPTPPPPPPSPAAAASVPPETVRRREDEGGEQRLWDWIRQLLSMLGTKEQIVEELEWTLDGSNLTALSAQGENGSLTFQGGNQTAVKIEATKSVRAASREAAEAFAAQVQIKIDQQNGQLHIYKEHPKPPLGTEVAVSFKISGPQATDLDLQTTNGKIEIAGATGTVRARSTNGKVSLREISGQVQAQTTNGKIAAHLTRLQNASAFSTTNGGIQVDIDAGLAPLTATTCNGGIRLALPDGFSGQLDAQTVNGRIHADVEPLGAKLGRRYLGPLGQGGDTPIKLQTTNGGIHLTARSETGSDGSE